MPHKRLVVNISFGFVKESHLVHSVELQSTVKRPPVFRLFIDIIADSMIIKRMVHATAFALRQRQLNVFVSNNAIRFSTIPSVNTSDNQGELTIALERKYNIVKIIVGGHSGRGTGLPTVTENLSSATFTEDEPNQFAGPEFVRAFCENGARTWGETKGL